MVHDDGERFAAAILAKRLGQSGAIFIVQEERIVGGVQNLRRAAGRYRSGLVNQADGNFIGADLADAGVDEGVGTG